MAANLHDEVGTWWAFTIGIAVATVVRGVQRRPRGVRAHQLVRVDVGDRHHLLRDPTGAHQRPAGHDHGRRLVRDPRSGRADRDQVVDLDHAARRPGCLVRAVPFEARTAGVRGRWQPGGGAPVGHRRQDDQVAVVHGGGPRRRNRRGDPHVAHHDRATGPGHDLRLRRVLGGRGGRHLDRLAAAAPCGARCSACSSWR